MRQSFINHGYTVAKDIIPAPLADDLLREAREIETTIPVEDPRIEEGVYCGDEWSTCLSQYPTFTELVQAPFLIHRVEEILQSSCEPNPVFWSLLRINPGQGDTLWHQDTDILDTKAKIGITLSLFGSQKRGTVLKVIPKSNRWPFPKKEQMHVSHPNEVILNISGQTAIFYDPLLWHTTLLNSSLATQWLLLLFYKTAEQS
ncbi:MAG: hypothetical protein AB4290_29980 [Spirulina sp.]